MNFGTPHVVRNPELSAEACLPLLEAATGEVFQIMLGARLVRSNDPNPPEVADLTAMVGLAGQMCAIVSLRCDTATARRLAAKMLGEPSLEGNQFDEAARDAIGEICNMVAGNFKAKVAGLVDGCLLSVPTVITGKDYHLHLVANGSRAAVVLEFEDSPIWAALDLNT